MINYIHGDPIFICRLLQLTTVGFEREKSQNVMTMDVKDTVMAKMNAVTSQSPRPGMDRPQRTAAKRHKKTRSETLTVVRLDGKQMLGLWHR